MKGTINSNFEPVVKIGIPTNDKIKNFTAVIDTGFNGFVSIPDKIIKQTSWQFIGYEAYELASGEIMKDKVYLGDVIFCNKRKYTYILSNKTDDILLGTKIFIQKILTINFKTKLLEIKNA